MRCVVCGAWCAGHGEREKRASVAPDASPRVLTAFYRARAHWGIGPDRLRVARARLRGSKVAFSDEFMAVEFPAGCSMLNAERLERRGGRLRRGLWVLGSVYERFAAA